MLEKVRTRLSDPSTRERWVRLGCVLGAAGLMLSAATAAGEEPLDSTHLWDALEGSTGPWIDHFINRRYALGLYLFLAGLQAVFVASAHLRQQKIQIPRKLLVVQVAILSFGAAVLLNWGEMGGSVPGFFRGIASDVTGLEGFSVIGLVGLAASWVQIFLEPKTIGLQIVGVATGTLQIFLTVFFLFIVAALLAVAIRGILLILELHVLVSIGPLFWAFGGFGYTAPLADNYIRVSARLGTEYLLYMMFVFMGPPLSAAWRAHLDSLGFWEGHKIFFGLLMITGFAIAWAIGAFKIPPKLAGDLVHLWSPGIAEGMSTSAAEG